MGVNDKLSAALVCPACGATEESAALDKGSQWSGSHWYSFDVFKLFDIEWKGGGKQEPEITKATCKCGATADVTYSYKP